MVLPVCLSSGLALVPVGSVWSADDVVADGAISIVRAAELVHLVRQDCGSCHGLTLKGGLGPALTADALYDKPAEGLVATIVGGRPGTPMPPFRGLISEAEAEWIVEQLMAGFPETAQATEARK
ncbi:MAG: c-type cytochrome [Rhodocyclaceae bacterium]